MPRYKIKEGVLPWGGHYFNSPHKPNNPDHRKEIISGMVETLRGNEGPFAYNKDELVRIKEKPIPGAAKKRKEKSPYKNIMVG